MNNKLIFEALASVLTFSPGARQPETKKDISAFNFRIKKAWSLKLLRTGLKLPGRTGANKIYSNGAVVK